VWVQRIGFPHTVDDEPVLEPGVLLEFEAFEEDLSALVGARQGFTGLVPGNAEGALFEVPDDAHVLLLARPQEEEHHAPIRLDERKATTCLLPRDERLSQFLQEKQQERHRSHACILRGGHAPILRGPRATHYAGAPSIGFGLSGIDGWWSRALPARVIGRVRQSRLHPSRVSYRHGHAIFGGRRESLARVTIWKNRFGVLLCPLMDD
jgi:hypothetical protein